MSTITMAELPLPSTCQRAALNGSNCHYASYGFVVGADETVYEVYDKRIVLCTQCCQAMSDAAADSAVDTIEEMQEMVAEIGEDSRHDAALPSQAVSLADLAAHFNQSN